MIEKLKIGDKVEILDGRGWKSWFGEMDDFIGKTGKVRREYPDGDFAVELDDAELGENEEWFFLPSMLKKITKESKMKEIPIGSRVMAGDSPTHLKYLGRLIRNDNGTKWPYIVEYHEGETTGAFSHIKLIEEKEGEIPIGSKVRAWDDYKSSCHTGIFWGMNDTGKNLDMPFKVKLRGVANAYFKHIELIEEKEGESLAVDKETIQTEPTNDSLESHLSTKEGRAKAKEIIHEIEYEERNKHLPKVDWSWGKWYDRTTGKAKFYNEKPMGEIKNAFLQG